MNEKYASRTILADEKFINKITDIKNKATKVEYYTVKQALKIWLGKHYTATADYELYLKMKQNNCKHIFAAKYTDNTVNIWNSFVDLRNDRINKLEFDNIIKNEEKEIITRKIINFIPLNERDTNIYDETHHIIDIKNIGKIILKNMNKSKKVIVRGKKKQDNELINDFEKIDNIIL